MVECELQTVRKELEEREGGEGQFDALAFFSGANSYTRAGRLDSIWSTYYDVFKSERIYGANLENLDAVAILIDQIVKRDKLPSENSLEAQRQLRNAWNTIDICTP